MGAICRVQAGRLTLPPICEDEWDDIEAVGEADNETRRRRDAALRAQREVRRSKVRAEKDAIRRLLERFDTVRRELLGVLASASTTDYRRFQTRLLLEDVDRIIGGASAVPRPPRPTGTGSEQERSVWRERMGLGAGPGTGTGLAAHLAWLRGGSEGEGLTMMADDVEKVQSSS
jgi:hypothetical protein